MNLIYLAPVAVLIALGAIFYGKHVAQLANGILSNRKTSSTSSTKGGKDTIDPIWLGVGVIGAVIIYFMVKNGAEQKLIFLIAVAIGIYAFTRWIQKPPSSWLVLATASVLLLFLSWDPTWQYVEKAINWWKNDSADETFVAPENISLAESVLIVPCNDEGTNWSTVTVPTDYFVSWSWSVEAEYSFDGSPFETHTPNTFPDADAFKFCSAKGKHIGKVMPLTWRTY